MKKIYLFLVLQLATVALFAQSPYCTASGASTDPSTEKISRVVFGTIDNASTSTAGYEDFTNLSTSLNQGSTNNMSVELSNAYASDQVLVWIDFNGDGDFADPGEAVYASSQGKGPFSFTVFVPTGAKPGDTRMRIRLQDAGYGPNNTPCGNSDYGQVEDYTVNIVSYSPYCTTSAPVPYGAGDIGRVMLGSIDNRTEQEGEHPTTSYQDFTNLSTNLGQGSENKMTVYTGSPGSSFLKVWIDFNQDGDFDDAGETVYTGIGSDEDNIYGFNFTVSVPAGAIPGTTRMRVKAEWDYQSYQVNNLQPCGNDGLEGQTEDYTVNVTPPASRYCAAGGGPDYPFGYTPIERISRVALGSINNASTSKSPYENFTTLSDSIKQGSTNNMSVEISNGYYSDEVRVWIDFNGDGDFADPGEAVYAAQQGAGPYNFTIAVPSDAKLGATRMRVRMQDANWEDFLDTYMNSFQPNNTPCGYSQIGQVEDYTVIITACTPHTFYRDYDKDGFGDPASTTTDCSTTPPDGYVTNNTDCNDHDASVHTSFSFYADTDGDGYGAGSPVSVCAVDAATPPAGYSLNNTDCAPSDATKWQSANLYIDADGDGYDVGSASVCYGATVPQGYSSTTSGSDCNDNDATKHSSFSFYADQDGDGFGAGSAVNVCAVDANTPPAGYSLNNTDCAPSDATKWRSASLYIDNDGDGYDGGTTSVCYGASIPQGYSSTTLGSDCNDNDATKWRSALLYVDADGDGYDNGQQTVCYGNSIPTGYRQSTLGSDCNDNNATVHPGAVEICGDGIDNNCNGQIDENCTVPYSLSINDVAMNEGNKGKSNMTFTVTLNQASTTRITVHYATQNGTATAGSDYTATSGTLTFNPGNTKQNVAVSIIGDKTVEPNETFTVVLSNPVNATLSKGTGTGTILNDDGTAIAAMQAGSIKAAGQEVTGNLSVKVLPNPTHSYFTLLTQSSSNEPLVIRTVDAVGRMIENKSNVAANGTLMLGGNYHPGIYFTEVRQGNQRVTLQLIKVSN